MKKVVKKLKPGKIIPIHTFHPDKYADLFSRKIEQVSDGEVLRYFLRIIIGGNDDYLFSFSPGEL
ncbi:MAG: hypothetical protein WBF28_04195 [Atribacterota bacterium]